MIRRTKDREGMIMRSMERPSKPVKLNMTQLVKNALGNGSGNPLSKKGDVYMYKQGFFYRHGNDSGKVAEKVKSKMQSYGLECTIVNHEERWAQWPKDSWFVVWFTVKPTQELEDRVRDDPKLNMSFDKQYEARQAEEAKKPKPKESLRGERRIVNPGTTPGRFKPNNRLGWSETQFNQFLASTKPGTTFRRQIIGIGKGDTTETINFNHMINTYIRWFSQEHPYPGVDKLLTMMKNAFNPATNGGTIDMHKVSETARQIEKRIKVIWDAARTERRLKSMIMAKARKSLGLR